MTGEGGGRRLRMAALAPGIPHEMITLLDGAGIDVVIPPSRDQRGVHAVLDGADVVLADWSSALRLGSPEAEQGPTTRELDELIRRSDVLVLVVPLTDETRGMIDAARLASMPRGAILVNAGRGGLVDEAALVEALGSGTLGGAALDVFAA